MTFFLSKKKENFHKISVLLFHFVIILVYSDGAETNDIMSFLMKAPSFVKLSKLLDEYITCE